MLNIKCKYCEKELQEFEALLFSPPDENNKVDKIHICKKCYKVLLLFNTVKQQTKSRLLNDEQIEKLSNRIIDH